MRKADLHRKTNETDIQICLNLDGEGQYQIATGVPFLNHMLELFTRHGFFDLTVQAKGDIEIDDHHTVEDVVLALGQAFREALGDKKGIRRFGEATVPLDEGLVSCVVDLSGRPFLVSIRLRKKSLRRRVITTFSPSVISSLRTSTSTGHKDATHTTSSAGFKAFARARGSAVQYDPREGRAVYKGTL